MPSPTARLLMLRQRIYALFGALLLATACLQAVGPITAPLERTQGSAFSAATVDVAVVRPRATEAVRLVQAPVPLAPLARTVPAPAVLRQLPPSVPARPDSTGPPQPDLPVLRPGPRAPPHS